MDRGSPEVFVNSFKDGHIDSVNGLRILNKVTERVKHKLDTNEAFNLGRLFNYIERKVIRTGVFGRSYVSVFWKPYLRKNSKYYVISSRFAGCRTVFTSSKMKDLDERTVIILSFKNKCNRCPSATHLRR